MTQSVVVSCHVEPGHLAVNQARRCRCLRGRAGSYKTARYRDAVAAIQQRAWQVMDGRPALDGPVEVVIHCTWPRQHRKGDAKGLAWGDADAPIKGILDALQAGGVFGDDAQVVKVTASKAIGAPSIVAEVKRA